MVRFVPFSLAGLLAASLLTTAPAPAAAQTATLTRDVTVAPWDRFYSFSSFPTQFLTAAGRLFFSAKTPDTGRELWVTDGTSAGTRLLADACPGPCDSEAAPVVALGPVMLFSAASTKGSRDFQLWRSDGTRRGTFPLTPGGQPDPVGNIRIAQPDVLLGGRAYFRYCPSATCDLWATDGTQPGTYRIEGAPAGSSVRHFAALGGKVFYVTDRNSQETELWTVPADGRTASRVAALPSQVDSLTTAGSRLFFSATAPGQGEELWVSDGTTAGTIPITSFQAPSPFPREPLLVEKGGRLYFVADDLVHGEEIWVSDGTPGGTRRITEIGHSTLSILGLELLGSRLVFLASSGSSPWKLWKTDGSPTSTAPLSEAEAVYPLIPLGGRVLFLALGPADRTELWVSDGTPAGTQSLTAACRGACDLALPNVPVLGSTAFFVARNAAGAVGLWRTDGTPAGTRPFSDAPGFDLRADLGFSLEVAALGRDVFFAAGGPYGAELWKSNGRPGSTRLVVDIVSSNQSAYPEGLVAMGDGVLFTACSGPFERAVWHSRGLAANTVEIGPGGSGSCFSETFAPEKTAVAGGWFFYRRRDASSHLQLWRTDGTPGSALQLTDFAEQGIADELVALGSEVFFPGNDGRSVWKSDGTPGGTRQAFALPPGSYGAHLLTPVGSELYFVAYSEEGGSEVWASHATQSGARRIAEAYFSDNSTKYPQFTRTGATVFYLGHDSSGTERLWRTAGLPDDAQILEAPGGALLARPSDLTPLGGKLYFLAATPGGHRGLWRTDGTSAGTTLVAELPVADLPSYVPAQMRVLDDRLLFATSDDTHGYELWVSDGTAAGTALLRDLRPGPGSSDPGELTVAEGRLFFTADDGVRGRELWQSDGTAAGTRLVQDIAPEGRSSAPQQLIPAEGHLFFSADDGLHGREVWSLPLGGPAGCQPSSTRICLGGRFAVEADWKDFQGNRGAGHGVALTSDTGYFWFFDEDNVEVMLKVLDGQGLNEHFWVFFGALSSVEYSLTVTDTQTGLTRHYFNPSGELASVADTTSFGPLGAYAATARTVTAAAAPELISASTDPAAATGICQPSTTRLCLGGGRFAVEATWKDFQGQTGVGHTVPLTGDTGSFWFFSPSNVEVVLKVLDGRPLNGHFWVFYGALSSVEYSLTVTDTQTGARRTYSNPKGRLASAAHTAAF